MKTEQPKDQVVSGGVRKDFVKAIGGIPPVKKIDEIAKANEVHSKARKVM